MAKFKNKKSGKVVVENLMFYIEKLRNNPNFEEIKEKKPKEEVKNSEVKE